jgi:hypothetical protein
MVRPYSAWLRSRTKIDTNSRRSFSSTISSANGIAEETGLFFAPDQEQEKNPTTHEDGQVSPGFKNGIVVVTAVSNLVAFVEFSEGEVRATESCGGTRMYLGESGWVKRGLPCEILTTLAISGQGDSGGSRIEINGAAGVV